jgi:cobalt-zinc-cadmium efflux system outer membrane protein
MSKNLLKLAAISFLLLISVSSFSQTQDTLNLNLKEAQKIFLEKNLSLLVQQYQVNQAQALIAQAKLWDNPQLSTDQNIFDNTRKFFNHTNGSGQIYVQIQQIIRTAGKIGKQTELAKDQANFAQSQFMDLMRNLKYDVQLNYFQLSQLEKQKLIYDKELSSLKKLVNTADFQLQNGNISLKENVRLKALLFSLQNDAFSNQTALNSAQNSFNIFLQGNNKFYYVCMDKGISDYPTIPTLDSLISAAELNRPDLKGSKITLAQTQHNLVLQKALAVPDLTVGLEYDQNSSYIPNVFGLSLSLPLNIFNRNQGNIKAASFAIKAQEAQVQLQQAMVNTDVYNAYKDYTMATEMFKQQKNFSANYDTLFQSMVTSFQKREVSLVEFIDFFDAYKQNRLQIYQQIYNLQKAGSEINYVTGTSIN